MVLKLSERRANGEPGFIVVADLNMNELLDTNAKLTYVDIDRGTGRARNEAGEDVDVYVDITTGKVIEKDEVQKILFSFLDFIGY